MACLNIAIPQRHRRESKILENPTRPSFIDYRRPRPVQAKARFLGHNSVRRRLRDCQHIDRMLARDSRDAIAIESTEDNGACLGARGRLRFSLRETSLAAARENVVQHRETGIGLMADHIR